MALSVSLQRKSLQVFNNKSRYGEYLIGRFSTSYNLEKMKVTLDNVFSDENKKRVQGSLLSVLPVTQAIVQKDNIHQKHKHESAILVPLCIINDQPSILFTLRSTKLKQHRGDVCFPGGRKDDSDPDLTYTAVREAWEELGIPKDSIDVWGALYPLPNNLSASSFTTAILAYCGHIDVNRLIPNTDEVEAVLPQSLQMLINEENIRSTQSRYKLGYTLPVYLGGEYRIWGLTATAVHQALTLVAPGLYNYKVQHNL